MNESSQALNQLSLQVRNEHISSFTTLVEKGKNNILQLINENNTVKDLIIKSLT